MNGKHIQQNSRVVIAFLLVVLSLTVAAIPALALEDAGTSASQHKNVVLNDVEMGHLSLKVIGRTSVAPDTPTIVGTDDDETGYFSLDGAHYVETTRGQPAQVKADDDEMGFLSLKAAGQPTDASETPVLAQGQ
jgi:hypothetical protein